MKYMRASDKMQESMLSDGEIRAKTLHHKNRDSIPKRFIIRLGKKNPYNLYLIFYLTTFPKLPYS